MSPRVLGRVPTQEPSLPLIQRNESLERQRGWVSGVLSVESIILIWNPRYGKSGVQVTGL